MCVYVLYDAIEQMVPGAQYAAIDKANQLANKLSWPKLVAFAEPIPSLIHEKQKEKLQKIII